MRRLFAALAALSLAVGARADSYLPPPNPANQTNIVHGYYADDNGLKGDYNTFGDGSITVGTKVFTSNAATFTAADVGKSIWVMYMGAATTIAPPAATVTTTPGAGTVMFTGGANGGQNLSLAVCYPRTNGLGAVTYFVKLTYLGSGGETLPSTETASIACGANQVLEITSPAPTYGAVAWNVYVSTTTNTETLQNDVPLPIGKAWFLPTTGLGADSWRGVVPVSNTTSIKPTVTTTIAGFTSAHTVTLTATAGASTSSANWGYGTDNTTALNALMTVCGAQNSIGGLNSGGGVIQLSMKQYYVASLINYANGCAIGSYIRLPSQEVHVTPPSMSILPALVINPAGGLNMAIGTGLQGVALYQWGIPSVNPGARRWVDGMSNYSGVAIQNISQDTGTQINNVDVVGFNTAFYNQNAQRAMLNAFYFDSLNGIAITNSHDPIVTYGNEGWTFLQANNANAEQQYNLNAVTNNGTQIQVTTTVAPANLAVGDYVRVENAGGFNGANNTWVVSSIVGNNVTLANSVASPAPTCTWALGTKTMTCSSLNSVAVGQTMTINSAANTVNGMDYMTNTLLLANTTVGTGAGTSVTLTNPAYTSAGSINLTTAYRGGVGMYMADSQGIHVFGANNFGYEVGFQFDQVSTDDKLGQADLTGVTCDTHQQPTSGCILVTNQQSTTYHGALKVTGLSMSIGLGTPIVIDGKTGVNNSAGVFLTAIHSDTNETTSAVASFLGGNIAFTGGQATPQGGPASQGFANVGTGVSSLGLANMLWQGVYLGFANPSQGNVTFSGDTQINGASQGSHILQTFTTAGTSTWYKPQNLLFADVFGCGGGGGGGSGASLTSGTASSAGGGGGGGGCFGVPSPFRIAAADLGTTVTVTVGAGGPLVNGTTANVNGTVGNNGSPSSFGTFYCGTGGGGGAPGSNAANGGGGGGAGFANNATACATVGVAGGAAGGNSTLQALGINLPANQGNGTTVAGGGNASSSPGSAGGGAGNSAVGVLGRVGGAALFGCGAGGSGGGLAAGPAATNGGGAGQGMMSGQNAPGGSGGAGGAGSASILSYLPSNGASGGASSATVTGFAGGSANPCGGGGGGGSAISTQTSGAGGKGGDGFVGAWMAF